MIETFKKSVERACTEQDLEDLDDMLNEMAMADKITSSQFVELDRALEAKLRELIMEGAV